MMPDWANDAIIVALIAAAGAIAGHLLNRDARREEVQATQHDSLLKRMGEQIDRLEAGQQQDRRRIDWLEDEVWTERAHSQRLRRGLEETTSWGRRMVSWAAGPQRAPHPPSPDWESLLELMETPRPRRPPPIPDST